MGLFSKPEVIFLKESSDAEEYLQKLEELLPRASDDVAKQIEKEILITKAGIAGENNIAFELQNSGMNMFVLRDIFLRTADGLEAQIDFVVVTSTQTFLIECKNLFGNIEINAKGDFIRTIRYGGRFYKEGIYSPISQNERHLMVLKECRAETKNAVLGAIYRKKFADFNKSLVVLANEKTVLKDRYAPKNIKQQVYKVDQLNRVIAEMTKKMDKFENRSSVKEMRGIAERILAMHQDGKKDYISKYEKLVEAMKEPEKIATEQQAEKICPRCGGKLVLRTAHRGDHAGKQFYGCSNFPKCRYIENRQ